MRRFFLLALFGACALSLLGAVPASASGQALTLPQDPTDAYLTLGVLAVAAVLFFTELFPLPMTAMLVPLALSLLHILPAEQAFSYFGNSTVVLFMAMFVVGESTFVTGLADKIGAAAIRLSKGSPSKLLLFTMTAIALLSSLLSNTGTIAVAVPMILGMCQKGGIAPGKILMPVAFASSLGGTLTLVGTPPNGIVNSILQEMGQTPFGFFEFGLIGLPLLCAGLLYYALIGRRLLPESSDGNGPSTAEEGEPSVRRPQKFWHSLAIFALVVALMASGVIPLVSVSVIGMVLVVLTGCVTVKEAFRCIDWTTIFLFAGMLSLSAAMESSGAAAIVANAVVGMVSDPQILMLVCCLLTALITNFMSNTATAALMAPLALPIALKCGISPLPIIMGIAASASCCFLTPIATPPNTIVFGPGRYSFADYVKAGWPLQVLSLLICWLLIPVIWPFHP